MSSSKSNDEKATIMFKTEILAVFNRWLDESDLDVLQMAEASVSVINKVCGEDAIDFEPDQDMVDKLDELPDYPYMEEGSS